MALSIESIEGIDSIESIEGKVSTLLIASKISIVIEKNRSMANAPEIKTPIDRIRAIIRIRP